MKKLFIDTNIVIDLLSKREGFYKDAQRLFTLADRKIITLYVSSLTFVNTHYILSKFLQAEDVRKYLIKLKVLVSTVSVDDKITELALASDFKDFEDAIQYHCALENGLDAIITRNKKDFKLSRIPVFTAFEYVAEKQAD